MYRKLLDSSYLARYLLMHGVSIQDYKLFPSRAIQNAGPAFHFGAAQDAEGLTPALNRVTAAQPGAASAQTMDGYLERNGTVAFLVIQHDRLLLERYYGGYGHESICTSFSVAKAFVSAMIGAALHEKLIGQLSDPLTKYLPELKQAYWSSITIEHLIGMCSGLSYSRAGFLPWNDQPLIYYSLDLRRLASRTRLVDTPGKTFLYNNYNLLLLGLVLERVTGGYASEYLQERIWKPLGMEAAGSWSMDSERSGMEKMESGINARAIDFAKFGRLYLRGGDWNGRQLLPETWVRESTSPWTDGRWTNFKYFWWIPRSGRGRFMTIGNLGQFIYVAPDKDCLILRFGNAKPRDWQTRYVEMFAQIADAL
jgi:CubicO group peptidase (beta-lactamase class C family)